MTKTGPELLAEAAAQPTLDELYRKAGPEVTREERCLIVTRQREERAQFIAAEEKKGAKRDGVVEPVEAKEEEKGT